MSQISDIWMHGVTFWCILGALTVPSTTWDIQCRFLVDFVWKKGPKWSSLGSLVPPLDALGAFLWPRSAKRGSKSIKKTILVISWKRWYSDVFLMFSEVKDPKGSSKWRSGGTLGTNLRLKGGTFGDFLVHQILHRFLDRFFQYFGRGLRQRLGP